MAGIYIHIPYCKQACHYCNFHFSTNLSNTRPVLHAIKKELILQKNYLKGETVQTIYLGGGTPSLLKPDDLNDLFFTLYDLFPIKTDAEITLEANPDDLQKEKLNNFKAMGVNRLSIGIQTFNEEVLEWMNRPHTGRDAWESLLLARDTGFDNISIDLIYGIPAPDHQNWQEDLKQTFSFRPEHISAYCLTIEPGTAFGHSVGKGKMNDVDEDFAAEQYEILNTSIAQNNYQQYEVSNFCRPGYQAIHNTNYWRNIKYLGVGPAAHSYNGTSRQYNVENNQKYVKALQNEELPFTQEMLTPEQHANEHLMTGLRTKWGCDLDWLKSNFNYDVFGAHKNYLRQLIKENLAVLEDSRFILTPKGRLFADKIAADLFL